ncbi:biopolymer transporter ExbD [Haliangium ochraceum]|uniref:Biopolymer transport protein ExbD/TolR n=1 Tax=Haliangium ochraceum (strain DSM 14365 / JCM 11303 / SMP-2) TaxID=502025 RepID=D0LJZ4_HALO1|nr:biopolymer transporter ExbD [Haliangium ochraceum]ACY18501.1 Biopolymer transport protein ExbD/TolR [Haliangium ochraceum DSM 14365]
MGISTGGNAGGAKSDINVTPLVDVVLVLLIIFLVATPIMLRYVTIEIPRKIDEETEDVTVAARQIVVTVKYDGTFMVKEGNSEDEVTTLPALQKDILERLESKKTEKIVFMDFEDEVPYEQVVSSMDYIKGTEALLASNKGQPDELWERVKVALKFRDEDVKSATN